MKGGFLNFFARWRLGARKFLDPVPSNILLGQI